MPFVEINVLSSELRNAYFQVPFKRLRRVASACPIHTETNQSMIEMTKLRDAARTLVITRKKRGRPNSRCRFAFCLRT